MRPRKHRSWSSELRRLGWLVVAALVLTPALPALAKSYWMAEADVAVVVNPDGVLDVTELLTYSFDGSFSGAYRDIRVRPGESIDVISVGDEKDNYRPGGCAILGCSSPSGTYGVTQIPGYVRIVWHHASFSQNRTFKLVYQVAGLAAAYNDVVDVNYQVWGGNWAVGVDNLRAEIILPDGAQPDDVRVWGHPYAVAGTTSPGTDRISPSLEASSIPPEQFVELRAVFPASLLASTSGATVIPEDGLESILAEERQFAEDASAAAAARRTALIVAVVLALVLILGVGGAFYWYFGREPEPDYDREYEQEPPSDLTPAEVGALLSQGSVGANEFTATLFDLIRKGAIDAEPTSVEMSTWGGLKTETITDLELSAGKTQTGFRDFEQSVLTVVDRVLEFGPRPLHEFKAGVREDAAANATTYQTFRSRVLESVEGKYLDSRGTGMAVFIGLGLITLVIASFLILPRLLGTRPGGEAMFVLIVVGMVSGAVALIVFFSFRRVRVRRTTDGAIEAARWEAFRRYLTDFSRLEEAPVVALDLWDRYLVYATVFGVAEEVLEKARIHAPPELEQKSSIYWFGAYGYSGGHTENAFAGITSSLTGVFTPSSSGAGGGFSGVGGGGGGGGGGGAW